MSLIQVNHIQSSCKSLITHVSDFLDISKVDAGNLQLVKAPVEIRPLLQDTLIEYSVEADKRKIALKTEISDYLPQLCVDRRRMNQVLNNLLSNAVKFTHPGGRVTLRARREGDGLAVSVIDTGIGIKEEDQGRIFQAFTQVDGSYARRYQGTGLGLTLVKKFVEMHGGRVTLRSRFGEGSDFTFTIPGVMTPRGQGSEPYPGDLREGVSRLTQADRQPGELILVVEDNPINMKLVRDILKASGYRVAESTTGEEALDALKFIRPDLILMDIQLPGVDGLRAARLLRDNPETRDIPVVALTAHVMKGDEVRAKEAGCAGYIPKPIEPSEFPRQIASFLRRSAGPSSS